MNPEVIAALLGAGLAGLAALIVQIIGARMSRGALRESERAARLGEFLAATHGAVLAISRLASLDMGPASEGKDALRSSADYLAREDRVNNSLNAVQLLDTNAVVDAAIELDWCLIRLEREALAEQWDREAWRAHRTAVIDDSVHRLVSAGRDSLGRPVLDRHASLASARARVASRDQMKRG